MRIRMIKLRSKTDSILTGRKIPAHPGLPQRLIAGDDGRRLLSEQVETDRRMDGPAPGVDPQQDHARRRLVQPDRKFIKMPALSDPLDEAGERRGLGSGRAPSLTSAGPGEAERAGQ